MSGYLIPRIMGVHRPHLRSKHIFPQTNIEHTKIVTIKIK